MILQNKQSAATINQIESTRPNIPKTAIPLLGYIGNSMNGGHWRPIMYKPVMAGEKHYQAEIELDIKLLTPKTPTYQKLKATIMAVKVPHSRVWKNAEQYIAQRGGSTVSKIKEKPNFGGLKLPTIQGWLVNNPTVETYYPITQTTAYRDSWFSSYYTRIGAKAYVRENENVIMPKVDALLARGVIACYNDIIRNKEYDEEIVEYNGDVVTQEELNSYLKGPYNIYGTLTDVQTLRAKKPNSYYTNFRTELQGFQTEQPDPEQENFLSDWLTVENLIAEAREQAENAQLNDWQILAKIRGSKMLSEGKVEILGVKTFDLNYSSITQNAYNTNENISPEFRAMGTQGAYSYTHIKMPIYGGFESVEEGYIHYFLNVWAETIYENGINRNLLNVTPLDEYRPDLIEEKKDVLYKLEMDTTELKEDSTTEDYEEIVGFKRKFTELFSMPNCIGGDLSTLNWYEWDDAETRIVETQRTFQFYEDSYDHIYEYPDDAYTTGDIIDKKPWKDYTDFLLNRNQAVKNMTLLVPAEGPSGTQDLKIYGNNQIFFMGKVITHAELPVDPEIVNNYTKWGEH